jgi:hypothetical protein
VGLLDSIRGWFKSSPEMMRDRHADREAGKDPKLGSDTPSGTVGPGGDVLDKSQGPGGAIEPDPPPDQG